MYCHTGQRALHHFTEVVSYKLLQLTNYNDRLNPVLTNVANYKIVSIADISPVHKIWLMEAVLCEDEMTEVQHLNLTTSLIAAIQVRWLRQVQSCISVNTGTSTTDIPTPTFTVSNYPFPPSLFKMYWSGLGRFSQNMHQSIIGVHHGQLKWWQLNPGGDSHRKRMYTCVF